MIKTVVFDMGGVLIHWSPDGILASFGIEGEDAALLKREVFESAEWPCLDRGDPPEEQVLAAMCRRLPERLHPAAARCAQGWWKEPLQPVEGMAELVREVKALGMGVYLLSNASSYLHQYFHRLPGAECFDGRLVSADWRLLKPQHEIYECFCGFFRLVPSECFFIDDNPMNIEGARRCGLSGTVFQGDLSRLRKELREAGVAVRER